MWLWPLWHCPLCCRVQWCCRTKTWDRFSSKWQSKWSACWLWCRCSWRSYCTGAPNSRTSVTASSLPSGCRSRSAGESAALWSTSAGSTVCLSRETTSGPRSAIPKWLWLWWPLSCPFAYSSAGIAELKKRKTRKKTRKKEKILR